MMKKKEDFVEYGFDSFTEEQKRAVMELKEKVEKILNTHILKCLQSIESALHARDAISETSVAMKKVTEVGGIFVSLEEIYMLIVLSCTFCVTKEESSQVDKILLLMEDAFNKINAAKEKLK